MILDDFQVAQKKCTVAKSKSDLSSSEDTLKLRKVRKRKVVKNSDSAGIIFIMLYSISVPRHIHRVVINNIIYMYSNVYL